MLVHMNHLPEPLWSFPAWITQAQKYTHAPDFDSFVRNLPVRCRKAITLLGVEGYDQLVTMSRYELLGLRNFAESSLRDLRVLMEELGFNVSHWKKTGT